MESRRLGSFLLIQIGFLFLSLSLFGQTANPNNPNDFQYVFLAGGIQHSVALRCNGTVVTWGDNGFGQLGNNNAPTDSDVPVTVVSENGTDSLINVIAVAAGGNHVLALSYDGTLWAWGSNSDGQLGEGTAVIQRNFPRKVVGIGGVDSLTDVVAIAAGGNHSLAIRSDGSVVSWGLNNSGQLGDSTKTSRNYPVVTYGLDPGAKAIDLAAGDCHSLVLQDDGRLKSCGCDNAGQLGDNGNSSQSGVQSLVSVNINQSGTIPIEGIIGIAAGQVHSLAIDSNGVAWSWGSQSNGTSGYELGRDCKTPECKFAGTIPGITNAAALVAGFNISFALLRDSTIMVWGDNTKGELGLGDNNFRDVPTLNNSFGEKVVALSGGGAHGIALMESDSLKSWGWNSSGQLGDGNDPYNSNVPVIVQDFLVGIVEASAGPDQFYCSGDSVQIGGESPGDYANYRYEWFPKIGLTSPGTTRPDTLSDPWSKLGTSSTVTIPYVLRKSYRLNTVEACIVTDTALITVYSGTTADFTTSIPPGCVDKPVYFYNSGTSAIGVQYRWNFGSGANVDTSSLENSPPITYGFSGTKHVTLKVFDPFCGTSDSISKLIPINDTPTVAFTHVSILCAGASVDFNNTSSTGTGITYSWDFGSGSSPSTSTSYSPQDILYSTPGTKTVTLTVDNGNCSSSTTSTITVETTPTAAFSSTTPSCQGDTVLFANNSLSAITYQWELDLNGTSSNPTSTTSSDPGGVVYSTDGLKTVRLVAFNGNCRDTNLQSIQINETPTSGFTSTAPNCGNVGIDFTNTGSSGSNWTYSWDFGQGAQPSSSTAENPTGVMYGTSGSKTVTLSVSDGNCSANNAQSISIQATPTATFTSTAPLCEQDSVSFTNTGSTGSSWTYNWNFGTSASPANSTQENPTGITYSTFGTKSIKLLISDGTCSDSVLSTITIKEKPTAGFTSSAPGCGNVATNFTNTGSTGGNWTYSWDFGSGAAPSTSSAENPSGITYADSGLKVVTLTITDGQCATTTIQNINILPTPTAAFVSTGPSCEQDSVSFTNTGSSGTNWTYNWDFGNSANPTTSTQENPTGITYSLQGTKAIKLIVSDGNCSDSISQNLTIYDRPDVDFNSTAPVCAGTNVAFVNTGSSGSQWTYSWSFGESAFPAISSAENPESVSYISGGLKEIVFTISNNLCSKKITDTISIYVLPVADAGKDTIICANTNVQLGSDPIVGYTYNWRPFETLDRPFESNPIASPVASNTRYVLTVEDANNCVQTDDVIITMVNKAISYAGEDVTICEGDDVQIGSSLIEGQQYEWTPTIGLNDPSLPNPIANPKMTTTYTLMSSIGLCRAVSDQVVVNVNPSPDIDAGHDVTIEKGKSTQLNANGGINFSWEPAEYLDNSHIYNPIASPLESTSFIVYVQDYLGCENNDTVVVTVIEGEFWVPDAFTPNGDGTNDIFYVRGVSYNVKEFSFKIYDEWGNLIFVSETPDKGWDGTSVYDNRTMPIGAYVYSIKGTDALGKDISMVGMVNLIR